MSEQQKQPPSIPPYQGGGSNSPCQGGSAGSLPDEANGVTHPSQPAKSEGTSSLPDKGGLGRVCLPDKRGRGEGFLPYDKKLTALARQNRSNPTPAEQTIWREVLRKRQLARFKFLRQKPIGQYIVDFYCSKLRLVIEIDGDSHAQAVEYDGKRTTFLNSLGLRVIRYTNDEVLNNLEGVYNDLMRQLLLEEAER